MDIRPAAHADFPSILTLNDESVRFLSPMSSQRLAALDREAALHVVIERGDDVVAFLLAFRERADYDSVNYRWFDRRYPSYLYIDRVVVARRIQGHGAGSLLYKRAFSYAAGIGIPILACEFDVDPPNPVSERFHAKFGFREVGRQFVADGNKQVSLRVAEASHLQGRVSEQRTDSP